MRSAFVAAVAVAFFAMPANADVAPLIASSNGVASPAQILADQGYRLHAQVAATATAKPAISSQLRFEKKMLDYYPIDGSRFHLEFGFRKDRAGAGLRTEQLFFGNDRSVKRKLSPGLAIVYDEPVGKNDNFSFDMGLRRSRNGVANQLVRLADAPGEQQRLGARASRFGPAAHVSFTHSF